MNGHVGGRFELVAPRRVTDPGDRWRLLALVLLAAGVHAWLIANTAVTAKDSLRFARHALALWKPNADKSPGTPDRTFPDVLRAEHDPPGYPLALATLYFPVKAVWSEPHSTVMDRALLAGQLASALAAVLTVFPMYWLGRLLFTKWVGFGAAAIFQCLPVYARESSDAISDSTYLFFVAMALLLAARGVKKPTVGRFLFCGLAVGMAYLVRPEGLFILFPCLAVVPLGMGLARRWTAKTTAACLTALAVGATLPAAPYMVMIGRLTNKPTANDPFQPPALTPRQKLTRDGKADVGGGPPFASWVPADVTGARRVGIALGESLKEWLKATHYGVGILAVIGGLFLWRRFWAEPELWVPTVYAGASAAAMFGLAEFRGYVSERHGLPLAMVCVYFAVAGLVPLFAWAARNALFWNGLYRWRYLGAVVCVGIIASGGRQLFRPLHDNRLGHKLAGEALHDEFQQARVTDVLADPYGWVRFYSGWGVYNIGRTPDPVWTADEPLVRWAVMELNLDDAGVPQPDVPKVPDDRHALAARIYRNLPEDGVTGTWKQVFQWPAADSGERPRVIVVKQTLPPRLKPKK